MAPLSLKSTNVLVTGGSRGLGAVICEKFAAEGANVAINYVSSAKAAEELAEKLKSTYGVKVVTYQADCGVIKECEELVEKAIKEFGGLDIIVGNAVSLYFLLDIYLLSTFPCVVTCYYNRKTNRYQRRWLNRDQGWTKMSKFGDLHALSEEDWDKVSPKWPILLNIPDLLKVLGCQCQRPNGSLASRSPNIQRQSQWFVCNIDLPMLTSAGGSFILTSSIAGASIGGSSMAYSISKAAQNHLMRCLAQTQGPKIRVNSVLPGLLLTDWVGQSPSFKHRS
jgi:NAD(P)-dependent dehydrogenase (short-subunit alcohol dehydrogenase family)